MGATQQTVRDVAILKEAASLCWDARTLLFDARRRVNDPMLAARVRLLEMELADVAQAVERYADTPTGT